MSSSSTGGSSGGSGSSGSSKSGVAGSGITRRQAAAGGAAVVGAGATGILGYLLGTGGGDDEETKTVNIPGYETEGDFKDDLRALEGLNDELGGYQSDLDSVSGTVVDDNLASGDDIRVALDGSTSGHPDQPGTDLSDIVSDPEYVLSDVDQDTFKTTTSSGGAVVERTFSRFQMDSPISIDADGLISEVESEYGLPDSDEFEILESDREQAMSAIDENSDLNVFSSTDLESEQPDANPAALANVREEIDAELQSKSEIYQEAVNSQREVDQLDSNLENALASYPVSTADEVVNSDHAENLSDYLDEVQSGYQGLTTGLAQDMARLATAKEVIDQTLDRADHVDDASRGDHYEESEPSDSETYNLDELSGEPSQRQVADTFGLEDPDLVGTVEQSDGDYMLTYDGDPTGDILTGK